MGRLTELFAFINEETIPSGRDMAVRYAYISKTPEVMAIRKEYLKTKRDAVKLNESNRNRPLERTHDAGTKSPGTVGG